MKNTVWLVIFGVIGLVVAACGNTTSEGKVDLGNPAAGERSEGRQIDRDAYDPLVPCSAGYCGDETFRAAIPTRHTLSIRYGASHQALGEVSEAYLATEEHIDEINAIIEDVFGTIEEVAASEPEVAESNLHVWRTTLDDVEFVMEVSTDDGEVFDFALAASELGFEFDASTAAVTGSVVLDESGHKQAFEFEIKFDQLGFDAADDYTGKFVVSATPFEFGLWQLTYDLEEVDATGIDLESTTYWVLGDDAGAIEYTYDGTDTSEQLSADVHVAWDEDGGRFDGLLSGFSDEYGDFEEVVTECWDGIGGLTFAAEAVFGTLDDYLFVEGDETECGFGLDAHPDLNETFASYFEGQDWAGFADESDVNAGTVDDPSTSGCFDAAETILVTLEACGFETYASDLPENRCESDAGETADCASALETSIDECLELESNPSCF